MASKISTITIDCANPARLAEFWTAALGYKLQDIDEEDALIVGPEGQNSRVLFQVVPEGKTVKNRVHLDLTPEDTREAEVERLIGLGATVYQQFDWTVMLDPEGNEFCVETGPGDKKAAEPAPA